MIYSIDRFEGDFAILIDDNGEKTEINKESLPLYVKEGDLLSFENGEFIFEKDETKRRRENTVSKFNRLFKR